MNLKINHTDEHNDYFTLSDDKGNEYPWHGRKGIKQDPEKVLLLIRKREYPGADFDGTLEGIETWIKEGHTNPEISEEYQEEVSPAVFALTPDDAVMEDRRTGKVKKKSCYDCRKSEMDKFYAIGCKHVDNEANYDFAQNCDFYELIDERKVIPEILEPAKFETRKRIIRPEQVIDKVEWVSTHPPKLAAIEALKAATTWAAGKKALLEIL